MRGIHQLDVKEELPKGVIGEVLTSMGENFIEDDASHDGAVQPTEYQITVDTANNNADYAFSVEGDSVSITSDGTATKSEIVSSLETAFESNLVANGIADVVSTSSDTLTIRGSDRIDFDAAIQTGDLSISKTQTADVEDEIKPARLVWWDGDDNVALQPPDSPQSTVFSVDRVVNDENYFISFRFEGGIYRAEFESSGSATEDDILNGLESSFSNLGLSDLSGTADTVNDTFTISADNYGSIFTAIDWAADLDLDSESGIQNLAAEIAGVTRHTADDAVGTYDYGDTVYDQRKRVLFLKRGRMVVDAPNASQGDPVYVGTDSSERGEIFESDGSGRFQLPHDIASFVEPHEIELKLGY